MQFSRLSSVCALGIVVALAGCGGEAKVAHPDVAPASGIVTYNGNPVAGATVAFVSPASKKAGWSCAGKTGTDGKFTISTEFAPGTDVPGLPPGDYTAVVIKTEEAAAQKPIDMKDYDAMSKKRAADQAAQQGAAPAATGPKSLVPAKYNNDGTSTLKVKIEKAGNESIELKLED